MKSDRVNKYLEIFKQPENEYWYAILIAAIIGIAGQIYFYTNDMVFAYADSVSHLNISRRFFDSLTPGLLSQMGIVWLPVPHLVFLNLTYIDYLWFTGLAGSIIGFITFIISAGYSFKIGEMILPEDRLLKWLSFSIFVFNPNLIYFQTTSMTEPLFYMFVLTSLFYLLKWEKTRLRFDLIAGGFYSALAMGTRYEGWVFTLVAGLMVFIIYYLIKRNPFRGVFLYLSFPIVFLLFWGIYNYYFYGDVLAFQRGEYSSEALMKPIEKAGYMPGKGNLYTSLDIFMKSVYYNFSPVFIWLALIGMLLYMVTTKFNKDNLIPYYTFFGFLSGIFSLYMGQVAIILNMSPQNGYFNLRYGLMVLPFIIYFISYTYKIFNKQKVLKYSFAVLVFINSIFWVIDFPNSSGSIVEANYFMNYRPELRGASSFLESKYDGKKILFDDKNIVIYPYAKIPMKDRINKYTYKYGDSAINKPSKIVGWILIDKKVKDEIYEKIKDNIDFKLNFSPVYLDNGAEVYKRR